MVIAATTPRKIVQVHLSQLVEFQCLRDLEDLPGGVNETGHAIKYLISKEGRGYQQRGIVRHEVN